MDQYLPLKKEIRLQQWQQKILECQSSGLKLCEWLKQNNITKDAYYYWLRKCRANALKLVPDEVLPQKENSITDSELQFRKLEFSTPMDTASATVTIRFEGAGVEVSENASQHTIEAVLLALKKIC